jgi:hypothetical protein
MNRRDLLAAGAGLTVTGFPFRLASSLQTSDERNHASDQGNNRHPVLVRSGFTRKPNGTDARAPSPSGMFDTEVVRSSDSEGRLVVFVFAPGDHHPIGAPRFTCITNRMNGSMSRRVNSSPKLAAMRLKPGDSLLMPMKVPHRWSVAQDYHCGAIHLYTPAGLMETEWASVAQSEDPKNQEARKAEFERHGLTLLGAPLSKEEIDRTL